MSKLPFHNKTTDYATTSKKGNIIYWDAIDNLTEEYVRNMLEMSVPNIVLEYDDILALGKEITDFVVEHLEKEVGANFPYVDESY